MSFITRINKWWSKFSEENSLSFKYLWSTLFILLLLFILIFDLMPEGTDLQPGDVSPVDITAPATTTVVDEEKTEELRQEAAESAGLIFERDSNVDNRVLAEISNLFADLRESQNVYGQIDEKERQQLITEIQQEYNTGLEDSSLAILLEKDEQQLTDLENHIINIMEESLEQKIWPEELADVREEFTEKARQLEVPEDLQVMITYILQANVEANVFLDEEATAERQRQAMDEVEPYQYTVRQGEIIVRQGDVVTEEDVALLEALGLQRTAFDLWNLMGYLLLIFSLLFIIIYFFRKYESEIWNDSKKLLFIELMVVIIVLLAKILNLFQNPYLSYLIPVAAISILITILINYRIAVIITVFISLLVAIFWDFSFAVALTSFCSGMVGIFSVSRLSQRSDLVKAGFNVSGIMVVVVFALTISQQGMELRSLLRPVSIAVLNGLLVAILANGLLPYLENIFDLTSSVKLLELSNASHPLLKRMLVEAPGSYHHSVIVGNLAETAADNIGADSLLTRVAAYYHDIGKLKRPYFFIENQLGGENHHDDISPNLSSLIIKSHVKDGVELAKKYKLPRDVVDIIEQHHSKNLISYFYQQAVKESKDHDSIEKSKFSYEGPKPQTKEAAIIMLADIVEAALRSKQFDRSNPNRIELVVKGIIRDKLHENQLAESDLTFKDLEIIGDSFVKVLSGIYHQRIEYPEKLLDDNKKDDKDAKSKDK